MVRKGVHPGKKGAINAVQISRVMIRFCPAVCICVEREHAMKRKQIPNSGITGAVASYSAGIFTVILAVVLIIASDSRLCGEAGSGDELFLQPVKEADYSHLDYAVTKSLTGLVGFLQQKNIGVVAFPVFSNRSEQHVDRNAACFLVAHSLAAQGITLKKELPSSLANNYGRRPREAGPVHGIHITVQDEIDRTVRGRYRISLKIEVADNRSGETVWNNISYINIDSNSPSMADAVMERYRVCGYRTVKSFHLNDSGNTADDIALSFKKFHTQNLKQAGITVAVERTRNFTQEHLDVSGIRDSVVQALQGPEIILRFNNGMNEHNRGMDKKGHVPDEKQIPDYTLFSNVCGAPQYAEKKSVSPYLFTWYLYDMKKSEIVWIEQKRFLVVKEMRSISF